MSLYERRMAQLNGRERRGEMRVTAKKQQAEYLVEQPRRILINDRSNFHLQARRSVDIIKKCT